MKCTWTKSDEHAFIIRCRTSPTGRYKFPPIPVDECPCGVVRPVKPDQLSWKQAHWINRLNKKLEQSADLVVLEDL